jgi:hypothetical protein
VAVLVLAVLTAGVAVTAMLLRGASAGAAAAMGAGFAALVVVVLGAFLRSRVTLTADEVVVRGVVITRRRARSRVAGVVRATFTLPRGGPTDNLFLVDADGGLVVRVHGRPFARADLDRLVRALGVPCDGVDRPVTAKEFGKSYPGLVPWAERHPYRLGLAIGGSTIVAVVALALALALATS